MKRFVMALLLMSAHTSFTTDNDAFKRRSVGCFSKINANVRGLVNRWASDPRVQKSYAELCEAADALRTASGLPSADDPDKNN